MDAIRSALKQVVESRRQQFIERYVAESQKQSTPEQPAYPPEALTQMLHGFYSMLVEAIDGGATTTRTTYLETIMPTLRDSGVPARMMIGGSAVVLIKMTLDLASHLPEPLRLEGGDWLADWFGNYLGEIGELWAAPATAAR